MSCLKLKVWPVLSVSLMSRGAGRVERAIKAALEATSKDTVLSVADLCVRVYRIEPSMVGKRHRVAVLRAFGQGQQSCAWSPSSVPKNVMTSSSRMIKLSPEATRRPNHRPSEKNLFSRCAP
jgi:hypothetical protein